MPDQLLLYDNSVKSWINTQFGSLVSGKTMHLMIGTPDRAFAQYVTPTGVDPDGRPPMPRIALTIEDPEGDPERYNNAKIRKLGYSDANYNKLRNANYPTPIRIPYTLNFWTEYKHEMSLYIQKVLNIFRSQHTSITVNIDLVDPLNVYGSKLIELYADSGLMNTGDLEPGTKERILRRTFNFHMNAWLWDLDFIETRTAKEFEFQLRDYDSEDLLEMNSFPNTRVLWSGDGTTTTFGPTVLHPQLIPIIKRTLILDATIGSEDSRSFDNGLGAILGDDITTATVDYTTGAITVEFATAPDNLTDINIAYFTRWSS